MNESENNFYKFIKELNKLSEKYGIYLDGNNLTAFPRDKNEKLKYKYDPLTLKIHLEKETDEHISKH